MGKRLYVGNLPYSASESDLTDKFSPHGTVESSKLITDRNTGRSKGFAFVEMSNLKLAPLLSVSNLYVFLCILN